MFTLAISYLTTSSLLWFMDLTFQVPMQYCSWKYQTLLPSPVISTTGCCFCFGSISSFFLELFFHWSLLAHWAPTNLGSSSFSVLFFTFSFCSWSSQGKNTEVVCHSLHQWTTFCQNSPPWPVCLGWPYVAWLIVSLRWTRLWSMWLDWLVFCDCGFCLSALWSSLSVPTILLGFLWPWMWSIPLCPAPDLRCGVFPPYSSPLQCCSQPPLAVPVLHSHCSSH